MVMGPPVHYCPDCDCYPCQCADDDIAEIERKNREAKIDLTLVERVIRAQRERDGRRLRTKHRQQREDRPRRQERASGK